VRGQLQSGTEEDNSPPANENKEVKSKRSKTRTSVHHYSMRGQLALLPTGKLPKKEAKRKKNSTQHDESKVLKHADKLSKFGVR
jgi:hypothetical protein